MKPEHKELLRERARDALRNLYHNATPTYPRELYGRSEEYAQSWFEDTARFEIEYIQGGGAYGTNYRKTLAAECNAGRYKSEKAREYYIRKGMRDMAEERAKYAAWERISEFGELFQYGRGGRTLAPRDLIGNRGGDRFAILQDAFDDKNAAAVTDAIRVLESFNAYVERWNASIPEQWREHCATEDAEIAAEKRRAAARKAKETRERNYWACRGLVTA